MIALVHRNALRAQPPNSKHIGGKGTNFSKSSKIAKINQNVMTIAHVYPNNLYRYCPERAMNVHV